MTQIRIYPSTRFVHRQGKALLLADVELIDEMGDSMKAGGHLRCRLFSVGPGAGGDDAGSANTQLDAWEVDLTTLADQKRYYDPITRGYLLRLELSGGQTDPDSLGPTLLRVTFIGADGGRVQTQQRLPIKW